MECGGWSVCGGWSWVECRGWSVVGESLFIFLQLAENSMESADCPRECKFDTSFLDDKLGLKQ